MKYICPHCGSDQLRTFAVLDVNTEQPVEYPDPPEIWCFECGAEIIELETGPVVQPAEAPSEEGRVCPKCT